MATTTRESGIPGVKIVVQNGRSVGIESGGQSIGFSGTSTVGATSGGGGRGGGGGGISLPGQQPISPLQDLANKLGGIQTKYQSISPQNLNNPLQPGGTAASIKQKSKQALQALANASGQEIKSKFGTFLPQQEKNLPFVNEQSIVRGLKNIQTGTSNVEKSNVGITKMVNFYTQGEASLNRYNALQNQVNFQAEAFNRLYGGKELTPEEFEKASAIQERINAAQARLNQNRRELEQALPTFLKSDIITKTGTYGIQLAKALGFSASVVKTVYNLSQTPKAIATILRQPSVLINTPSGIWNSIKTDIKFIGINPNYGIMKIATDAGTMFALGSVSKAGKLSILKRINPKYEVKLFNSLKAIPRANLTLLNYNLRKIGVEAGGKVIKIVGKVEGTMAGKGLKKINIRGNIEGISRRIGKDKSINYSFARIRKEGKVFQGKQKSASALSESKLKKAQEKTFGLEKGGKVSVKTMYPKELSTSVTKGFSLTEVPIRNYVRLFKGIDKKFNVEQFVSASLERQINRNLIGFVGKAQGAAGTGAKYTGYFRTNIRKFVTAVIRNDKQLKNNLLAESQKIFKENIANNYMKNYGYIRKLDTAKGVMRKLNRQEKIKLGNNIINSFRKSLSEGNMGNAYSQTLKASLLNQKLGNELRRLWNRASEQAIRKQFDTSLKQVNRILETSSGAIQNAMRSIAARQIKAGISKEKAFAIAKEFGKEAVKRLSKGASLTALIQGLSSASKSKMIQRGQSIISPKVKEAAGQISPVATAQRSMLKTKMITPLKTKIVGGIPIKPITTTPIRFTGERKSKGEYRKLGNNYYGYVVAGKKARTGRILTRLPIVFSSSLNIAAYYALHNPSGVAIIASSTKSASKKILFRYPKLPKDYFSVNRNKLNIIKQKRRIILKRR